MVKHLACIMDGNRRWAKKRGWLPWVGHEEGLEAAKRAIEFCLEKGIPYLSLYSFSLENFRRPAEELSFLFNLFKRAENELSQLIEHGVRIRFVGDRSLFPEDVRPVCERVERNTAHGDKLHVDLLFCYGGRQEIVNSVKCIVQKIKHGELSEDQLSESLVSEHLWTSGVPEPDLVIRTGAVKRLSNFLIYQAAYAELYFLDCMWPEITKEHFEGALTFFNESKRNFGA